ncbi:telomeric repeat-binding factor 2-interacting protein 1-like isoform X2 [Bufo gargarizans]|uniref:telomeric repeat-binding factor 2-interacting protein 1-like isoform X2 n=1 Tax=Bufo gargarizans TaxID=30331 RepID=UPI001CF32437|nr:telomeric repeat-binding factor 2-interacting protein 1-like isoform X2 [Bufo gargarizans]
MTSSVRAEGKMAALFSHSRSLFITDVGPMRFYVRPGPLKRQLSPLICHGGGIVCRVQEPGAFLLSEPGQAEGIQYMASTYVTDCVRKNRRLSPRSYRLARRVGAPDKQHLWERKGPPGATPASCEGSPAVGGPREGEPHTALESDPAVNGAGLGVITPGAPASQDHGPPTTGAPASQDHGPSTTGAPAARDLGPSTTGAPAARDLGPSTTGAPAARDLGPSTTGAPAARDLGPSTTGAPAARDLGPSTTGAPAARDLGPSTTGAPAARDLGPSTTGAPAARDLGPSTTGAPARQDEQVADGGGDKAQRAGDNGRHNEVRVALPKRRVAAESGWRGPMRRRMFCWEEDVAIFQYVRENEAPTRLVTGTLLWKELEQKGLLCRTWQAMKTRYTRYILQNAHCYNLPATSQTAPARTDGRSADQQGGPSCAGPADQQGGPSCAGPADQQGGPSCAGPADQQGGPSCAGPADQQGGPSCAGPADQQGGSSCAGPADQQGGPSCAGPADQHPVLLPADTTDTGGHRLRSASRRIETGETPKTVQESGDSSWEGGYDGSVSTSRPLPNTQENQDIDSSEDVHVFEIANMEFEVEDEDSGCNVMVPLISLDKPVVSEVTAAPQLHDATSSPHTSDDEGLQDAIADMMKEFKLDVCQVTQALLKNNGEVGSTRVFLRTGLRPDGFPIWEYKDDVELQRNDPAVWPRLARKYGSDNVAKRVAFLASYKSSFVPQQRP